MKKKNYPDYFITPDKAIKSATRMTILSSLPGFKMIKVLSLFFLLFLTTLTTSGNDQHVIAGWNYGNGKVMYCGMGYMMSTTGGYWGDFYQHNAEKKLFVNMVKQTSYVTNPVVGIFTTLASADYSNHIAADTLIAVLARAGITGVKVTASMIDTQTEINNYNVIIMGGSGQSDGEIAAGYLTVQSVIKNFVQNNHGGVIFTGWSVYSLIHFGPSDYIDMLPVEIYPDYGGQYSYTLVKHLPDDPLFNGVGTLAATGYCEFPEGGLKTGAIAYGGLAPYVPYVSPTVTTTAITTFTGTTATMGGNVTAEGSAPVTARGVVYSSTDNTPELGESGVSADANGSGTGSFSEQISGLTAGTTYYVRAYATSTVGTSYGGTVNFTTQAAPVAPVITSFSPASGTIGTTVTITGSGYSTTPANNTVWFGAVKATVSASTATSITVTVPVGAGSIVPVYVQVNGLTAYSETSTTPVFNLTNTPTILPYYTINNTEMAGVPAKIAVGDLNGDGIADIATANEYDDNVGILMGTGSGNFSAANYITVGTSPFGIALGDLNGDGNNDIVSANQESSNISVLLGDGAGAFASPVNYMLNNKPNTVNIADFNGDGIADLVTSSYPSSRISIMLGTGGGNFATATYLSIYNGGSQSVAIGDYNSDGKADLATANSMASTISIFLGVGNGTFSAKTDFPTGGTWNRSIESADFNNDGHSDLVVSNQNSDNVSVLLGNGAGNFSAPSMFAVGDLPRYMNIGDFNGDGNDDIAAANYSSYNISLLLGDGFGSFAAATNIDLVDNTGPHHLAAGDFNNDGKADIATCNYGYNSVSILLWSLQCVNPTSGGNIAEDQIICHGNMPATLSSVLAPSGHTGTLEYKWQLSTTSASAGFNDIELSNSDTWTPGELTVTTWFRRMARVECITDDWASAAVSNTVTITVLPEFTAGAIETTGETICYNNDPSEIPNETAANGGDGTISYQWQSSTTGEATGFANITGADEASYIPPTGLTQTTWYRRMAKDGTCSGSAAKQPLKLNYKINSPLVNNNSELPTAIPQNLFNIANGKAGGISPNHNRSMALRYDDGVNLDGIGLVEGGTFQVSAYWPAATMELYTGMKLSQVEIYIRDIPSSCVIKIYGQGTSGTSGNLLHEQSVTATLASWNLISLSSEVEITGEDLWIGYEITHNAGLFPAGCDDGPAVAGFGDMLSIDGSSWMSLAGVGFDYNWNIAATLSSGGQYTNSAGVWKVEVLDDFTPGAIETTGETICYNGDPAEIGSTTPASGGDQLISYQWQSSATGESTDFADISGAEEATYNPPSGITGTTWFLRMAKDETCQTSFSASTGLWKITVEPTPVAGLLTKTPDLIAVCENDNVSAILTAGNGGNGIDELEFRTNDGTWSAWAAYTSGTDISTADLSGVEIRTRRMATYCENSAYVTVGWSVEATPIAGSLAKTPNVMNVCENDNVSAILTSGNGGNGIDELEFRTNDGEWSAWAAYTSGENISTADLSGVEIRTRRTAAYCENSAYVTVGWSVEATSIAGSLDKTPDVLNVCENDIVSAILTSGNGGNGTDQLEFRTNDGIWSAWAAYTSGTDISTADLSGVEIRTRRMATYCENSAYVTVGWSVEATPIAGSLAKTPNVMTVCENDNVSAILTSGNGGNSIDELEFRTNDGIWSAWAAYTSGTDISTADLSGVEIRTRCMATYCENSAYVTVGWNVEATPIAGSLAKTPDMMNVCENDNVSAILTAGNGGNGIDELEFRTNDGTWSAWAAYTSGTNISTADLSGVEIRTRRMATYCENSAYTTVGWSVEATPIAGSLAKNPDVLNVCENDNVSAILTAGNGGNGIDELEFRTNNGIWSAWATYTSGTNISTADLSGVEIRTRRTASYCESTAYTTISWSVEATPIAGTLAKTPNLMNVCEDEIVSAILTSGNGGNGIDELEFRTNNGTWSAWAAYTSGANISTADLSGVEIRTRRTASYCESTAYVAVSWSVEATPIAGTLTKTPNVLNVCENDIVSAILTAVNGGNGIDELEFRTNNGTWSAWAAYTSGTDISTADLSEVEIRSRRMATYCENSTYTTVSWSVEATPIAGTLAKTPNLINVCEDEIVSAILTSGNGGNGIDELEFRTNDGTWSAWAAYTSGTGISANGKTAVEMRTRRLSNTCEPSTYVIVAWNVNPLPVPVITGPASICVTSSDIVYSTESSMTGYTWTISAGGTITAGMGTNEISVTWNTTGPQFVSVNYTNANGCTAQSPTVYPVTVNPLPAPTISGLNFLCVGTTGEIYTTEPGMTNYTWTVSEGGTITAGALTNAITVSWNNDVAQILSVNYVNENGCTAPVATFYDVTVASLPVPTITGPAFVCAGETNVIYTTQSSMSGYNWSVSDGGMITSGNGTNQITVTWNNEGPQTVCVNYTNTNGCTANSPSVMEVTVRQLPTYSFDMSATEVCSGETVDFINYFTGVAPWTVVYSYNGVQSSFTTSNNPDYYSEVFTETTENRIISVTDGNGCTAFIDQLTVITVNPLPIPTIEGSTSVCLGDEGEIYTTESGMSGYNWNVSDGGTITAGAGTNAITVDWNGTTIQTVSVNYTNENSCTAANASIIEVTVTLLPLPTILGSASVCAGSYGVNYTTEAQMNDYNWTISSGGSILSGNGTHEIMVNWNVAGDHTISVNYTNANGCTSVVPGSLEVEVRALPAEAGSITGTSTVCAGTQGVIYSIPAIANASICFWTLPEGATIVSGFGTNSITVDFDATAVSGMITVRGANTCGQGIASPAFSVTVNPIPETPVITQNNELLTSSAPEGNQWFFNGIEIPGANGQQHEAMYTGEYSVMVTLEGCSSEMSDIVMVTITGNIGNLSVQKVELYPNPNHGQFTLAISSDTQKKIDLRIFTNLGVVIYEKTGLNVQGTLNEEINLSGVAPGVYYVRLTASDQQIIRKVVID